MTAPTITGAVRVVDRYGGGVYRFANGRGLSVAPHKDWRNGFAIDPDRWDAVEAVFDSDDAEDFTLARDADGRVDLRQGLTLDDLADIADTIRRKR